MRTFNELIPWLTLKTQESRQVHANVHMYNTRTAFSGAHTSARLNTEQATFCIPLIGRICIRTLTKSQSACSHHRPNSSTKRILDGGLGQSRVEIRPEGRTDPGQMDKHRLYSTECNSARNLQLVRGGEDNWPTLRERRRGIFNVH